IPVLHQCGHSIKHICHLLGVKKTLVYKVLQLCPSTWSLQHSHIHSKHTGWHRTLTIDDIAFITAVLHHHPTIYLNELQHQLHSCCGVLVSVQTLLRTFSQLYFKHKHISAYALE
ncbi:hypothetical protein BDR05DRAFT_891210, partial [Suillus weaverae]